MASKAQLLSEQYLRSMVSGIKSLYISFWLKQRSICCVGADYNLVYNIICNGQWHDVMRVAYSTGATECRDGTAEDQRVEEGAEEEHEDGETEIGRVAFLKANLVLHHHIHVVLGWGAACSENNTPMQEKKRTLTIKSCTTLTSMLVL